MSLREGDDRHEYGKATGDNNSEYSDERAMFRLELSKGRRTRNPPGPHFLYFGFSSGMGFIKGEKEELDAKTGRQPSDGRRSLPGDPQPVG